MEDYKKLVNRLREEPKDSRKAVLSIYDLCVDAACAIESLLDKLKYAEGERDVVTKGMIELEQEVGRLRKEKDAAIKALDEALIMDNRECFDGENFPCGYRQWCDLCDENEERGCAKAYLKWLGSQKEADT